MNAPPFLIGAAVLFWSWQTGLWPFGIPIALIIEAARWLPWRLELAPKDFRRVWDVCAMSLMAVGLYVYSADDVATAVLSSVQWLPIFIFPLVAAQVYASKPCINGSTFFWLMRRHAAQRDANRHLDISFGYLAICLLGASAANVREPGFYAGACLLTAVAIWANRSRRVPVPIVAGLFVVSIVIGLVLSTGFRLLQADLEQRTARWLARLMPRDITEQEGFMRIGEMGAVKLSGRVVLRVEGEIPNHPPDLLRQLTFSRYESGAWFALRRDYRSVAEEGTASWTLVPAKNVRRSAIISMPLQQRRTVLPLPQGTARISELPAIGLDQNRLGTVRAETLPGTVHYRVAYGPNVALDGPPERDDLDLPRQERTLLRKLADEIGLQQHPPANAMTILASWFNKHFEYSLDSLAPRTTVRDHFRSSLRRFLTDNRRGHCEYFATAAVLLLRAAGIPARYAMGYSVQEPAPGGKGYIVRERHAHAWAIVYVNGKWVEFDPTPPSWEQTERERASFWRGFTDWFSELRFAFGLWRWEDKTGLPKKYLFGPLFILGTAISWRLFSRKHRQSKLSVKTPALSQRGTDSEFYAIEKYLRKKGLERQPCETPLRWAARLQQHATQPAHFELLPDIIELHYRYRFDQLSSEERQSLANRTRAWLRTVSKRR